MRNFASVNREELYMQRCNDLASRGIAQVAPNPMVGAVLVYEDRVIGEGYHMQYGQAHAEVNCLASVKAEDQQLISRSTLYVSLEPCNHFGKTPPCTDLIIRNKIPEVVIGCSDSFEKVNGTGIQKLKEAGINVKCGILEEEAQFLNRRFFTFHQKQRPYIILKWAQSKDGFIAADANHRTKISNEITDKLVHQWRSEESAIMVGTHTVHFDNPELTVRHVSGRNPVRVIIDKNLSIPDNSKILNQEAPTIIFNEISDVEKGLNRFVILDFAEDSLSQMMSYLYRENILSVIVEGGQKLLQSFIDQHLWDEARVITNNDLELQGGVVAPQLNAVEKKEEGFELQNNRINFYYQKRG